MASNRTVLDRLTCRQVLHIMVTLGFMLNYMLRVNLTIAIVSMVTPVTISNSTSHSANLVASKGERGGMVDATNGIIPIDDTTMNDSFYKAKMINGSALSSISEDSPERSKYSWNEYEINLMIGSFFWGYICTELPGGRLAEVVGARRVFGYSMLMSSGLTLLTPLSASFGYGAVITLRVILGFLLGVTWPAMHPMTARWIPPTERSKFISSMMASSLGAAITMPLCGFLIASLGWEWVFYVTGVIGLVWSVAWFLLIFDTPAQHPRISMEERRYIEDAIGTTSTSKHLPVPWKAILTSPRVWAIVITHGLSVFGYFTVVNQLPTYMKYILNFNIKENGMLSSLPYLGKYIFAVTIGCVADNLRRNNRMSVTAIRKVFTIFALTSPGILMILQAYVGYDRVASVTIFTIALTLSGAVTAGYLGNGLDIAPNFSGTIFGIANTLSSLGGYLSTFMVGTITYKNQTYAQWRIIFWILAVTYCTGALVFALFGTGELQTWNNPLVMETRDVENGTKKRNGVENTDPEEAVPLKAKALIT